MIARVAMMGAVLVTALLLTTVVAPAFAIAGVRPDLVLLSVVAFALIDGPGTGARYGFSAGLASDLVSGPSQLIGLGAFVLLTTGYLVGLGRRYLAGSPVAGRLASVAAATVLGVLGYGVSALLLDLSTTPVGAMTRGAIGLALYHVILAPLVFRPVSSLSRRFPGILPGPGGLGPSRGGTGISGR